MPRIVPLFLAFVLAGLARAQDVVLVILDDVGKVDLEQLMADGRAPNLAAVAARGLRFENAIANPVCQASRRSISFGDFRVHPSGDVCAQPTARTPGLELISLAERARRSSAVFGKWHEGANPAGEWPLAPRAHGWGAWRAGVPGGTVEACGGIDYSNWIRVEDGRVVLATGVYQPEAMFRRWNDWWSKARGPRLVVYSAQLAHEPYHRPPDAWLPAGYRETPTARDKFEAMIVVLDRQVGGIVARLTPDDVLIVVGDNGTPREVAGTQRAKTTTFERGIRVPLIFAGGLVPKGASSEALVHVVDLYATIAELCGATADPALDSRSLVPLLRGDSRPVHEYVLAGTRGDRFVWDVCARSLRYKLRRVGQPGGIPAPFERFHDLATDPEERIDLIDSPAHQAEIALHRAWLDGELGGF